MSLSKPMAFLKWERITRRDNDPYLDRLVIFRCNWFSVFLHIFRDGDDECMHDHPWPFVSVILRGGYWEHTDPGPVCTNCNLPCFSSYDNSRCCDAPPVFTGPARSKRWYRPGSVLFRRSDHAHRVEIDRSKPAPVTLVFVGRRCRDWGFYTRFGWLPWRRYRHSEHCV